MSTRRRFHIGDILSVTTGKLLAPRGIGSVYQLLGYLTGQTLYTHQLPRACREVREAVLAQVPALRDVTAEEVTPVNWWARLRHYEQRYGAWHVLRPVPDAYRPEDPITEVRRMTDAEVIVVARDGEAPR